MLGEPGLGRAPRQQRRLHLAADALRPAVGVGLLREDQHRERDVGAVRQRHRPAGVGDEAADDDLGIREQGVVHAAPLAAQPLDAVEQVARHLDRVDGAALAPVGGPVLGVPGAPRHGDLAVGAAAAGRPHLEPGRLGDDREVGRDAVARAGERADAGGLLVGVRADDHVAAQVARRRERLGRDHHRGDPALHVARAAADQAVALDAGAELLRRPGHDVDVAVEQQRAAAARAAEARRELRAALEADAVRGRERVAGDVLARGLPDLDLGARRAQPLGQVGLQLGLLPGGVARVLAAGRVVGDQLEEGAGWGRAE